MIILTSPLLFFQITGKIPIKGAKEQIIEDDKTQEIWTYSRITANKTIVFVRDKCKENPFLKGIKECNGMFAIQFEKSESNWRANTSSMVRIAG